MSEQKTLILFLILSKPIKKMRLGEIGFGFCFIYGYFYLYELALFVHICMLMKMWN